MKGVNLSTGGRIVEQQEVEQEGRTGTPNAYPGQCRACGGQLAAGEGVMVDGPTGYESYHRTCPARSRTVRAVCRVCDQQLDLEEAYDVYGLILCHDCCVEYCKEQACEVPPKGVKIGLR